VEFYHNPVLLYECIEMLNIRKDGIYVDGTIGGGGHSSEILKKLGKDGILIGLDRDAYALESAGKRLDSMSLEQKAKVILVNSNFKDIKKVIRDR